MTQTHARPALRRTLEDLYARYHRRCFIGTDPVSFVHAFKDAGDQELVGLIAASLAYGNVRSIHASIRRVLDRMGPSPRAFLADASDRALQQSMRGFRHRWTCDRAMTNLLAGMRDVIRDHGGLGRAFRACDRPDADIRATLADWVRMLSRGRPPPGRNLLADPSAGSACKRLFLYLRWMVRRDEIDPGCWPGISPARLKVPLDTHVFMFARAHGMTRRRTADARTVDEITRALQRVSPEDPVRYDFALTRPGILGL